MPDTWPLLIDATRIEYRVASDRSNYLLTVHSLGNPSVDIRLPIAAGADLLEQIQNMVATGDALTTPQHKPTRTEH